MAANTPDYPRRCRALPLRGIFTSLPRLHPRECGEHGACSRYHGGCRLLAFTTRRSGHIFSFSPQASAHQADSLEHANYSSLLLHAAKFSSTVEIRSPGPSARTSSDSAITATNLLPTHV